MLVPAPAPSGSPTVDLRLMLIGSYPPPVGGTTVSLEQLRAFVERETGTCIAVDTSLRGRNRLRAVVTALATVVKQHRNVDVVTLHFSDRATVSAGPLFWLLCRLLGKPVLHRQFGGQFSATFQSLPRWRQWWLRQTILDSDAVLLQTKAMVADFDSGDGRTHWFPTARTGTSAHYEGHFASGGSSTLRCVFVGHVRAVKGVLIAAAAVTAVPEAELDIYGPLIDVTESDLATSRVRYRGALDPAEVPAVMAGYDVLLFPTQYKGEGYSGTLVEAALVGLPMIVSRWQSLPEMFPDGEAVFIEPGSVEALVTALRDIVTEPRRLHERSMALKRRARDFDAEDVFRNFLSVCTRLAKRAVHQTKKQAN